MIPGNKNSYKSLSSININDKNYKYYSLKLAEDNGLKGIKNFFGFIKNYLLLFQFHFLFDIYQNPDCLTFEPAWFRKGDYPNPY